MENPNEDQPVLNYIQRLVAEEHRLHGTGLLHKADRKRLVQVQVELDQCWDLLRQRRALRDVVKPGFVQTDQLKAAARVFFPITPEKAAQDIWRAMRQRRQQIYTPGIWALIMLIVRNLSHPSYSVACPSRGNASRPHGPGSRHALFDAGEFRAFATRRPTDSMPRPRGKFRRCSLWRSYAVSR